VPAEGRLFWMRASTQPKRQKYFFISLFLRLLFAIFTLTMLNSLEKQEDERQPGGRASAV
jgi:hypothetical protein